ncbi:MAG: PAS domain-containing protein, partial [Candidatus Thorarchaeota archaeon]
MEINWEGEKIGKDIRKTINREIISEISEATFAVDNKWQIIEFNNATERLMGYMKEEVLGMKCEEVFGIEVQRLIKNARKSGKLEIIEELIINDRDEENISCTVKSKPLKDKNGTIIGTLGFIIEKATTDKHIQKCLEGVATPVVAIDKTYNITYINPAGANIVGKTNKEVIGKKCYDLFKTSHCNTPECRCNQAMEKDEVLTGETIACPKKDQVIPIRYTATPLKNDKGNIIGAVEYVVDISEIKEAMIDAQQKVDNLNHIPTPVMAIDKNFNVTYMNPAGAGVVGKTVNQVIGMKCYDLFKTPHCKTSNCALDQAMNQDKITTAETVARPTDDKEIPIKYTGAPIKDDKGNMIGALEYVVDITDIKKAMTEAQQKIDNLNSIPTPIMAIDKDFSVTFMNPAGASVVGKNVDQVLGMKCYDLFKTPHCRTQDCALG